MSNLFITALSFFTSKVIKDRLGLEILGLNGVFTNVISVLSLTELGIGTAITFALYKPLVEGNEKLIKSIMAFYKKAYQIVAALIAVIGICLIPFLKYLVKSDSYSHTYIIQVFILFLLNAVVSYLLVYKRTLIIADQKNYIITILTLFYTYTLKISQFVVVFFTSNYLFYLAVNVCCTFIYNLVINVTCNKLYPYLKEKNVERLPDNIYSQIVSKVKALFLHSIGTVVVLGTDNILISYYCGMNDAGRYASYATIIVVIGTMLGVVFDNIKDSVGNFLVCENGDRKYNLYKKIFFINQFLVSVCSICLLLLLTPFVKIWLGDDATVSFFVVFLLVVNFYLMKNNLTIGTIKAAAGLFEYDKYAPIVESIINLVSSIILVHYWGIGGIVAGTVLSNLAVPCWVAAFVVHKKIFQKSIMTYFKDYLSYTIRTVIICTIVGFIFGKVVAIRTENFLIFFLEALGIFLLSCFLWLLSVLRKPETKDFYKIIKSKFVTK